LDAIYRAVWISIARGCGFAGLAIGTLMAGLAFDPWLALRSGAILLTLLTAVLLHRAYRAPQIDCRRTEAWILLPPEAQPPKPVAQRLFAAAMRTVCLRCAEMAGGLALLLWLASFAVTLLSG